MVRRIVPNLFGGDPAATRSFYVDMFDLDVPMDMGWIATLVAPDNAAAQLSIFGPDAEGPEPFVSIEVDDVDAVHDRAIDVGCEIVYSLRDEEWGVRRFMVRDPGGRVVNVLSHITT